MKLSENITAFANDASCRIAPTRSQIEAALLAAWSLEARELEAAADHAPDATRTYYGPGNLEASADAAHGADAVAALSDLIFALMSASCDPAETASNLMDALAFAMRRHTGWVASRLKEHHERLTDLQKSIDP